MPSPKDPSLQATDPLTSRRSVIVGLVVAVAQTVALGVAAYLTGSVAMRTQTVTNVADVAVGAFLLLGVPDIFAIVVGPSTLIVNGDIIFDDALDVPQVAAVIVDAGAALRTSWPAVTYVYLNPVAGMRSRRGDAVSPARPAIVA